MMMIIRGGEEATELGSGKLVHRKEEQTKKVVEEEVAGRHTGEGQLPLVCYCSAPRSEETRFLFEKLTFRKVAQSYCVCFCF